MIKFTIIGIAVVLLVWIFLVSPELKYQLDSFDESYEQRGLDRIVSSYGGELSEPFVIEEITTTHAIEKDGIMEISANILGKNLETNEIIFEFDEIFFVDKKTKKNVDESLGFYSFPHNTEQKNYFISNPLITTPTTFVFEDEVTIFERQVYHFSCDSKENDFSNAFPQFEDRTILIDYECDVWVEPITGNILDYKSSWDAYFVENGIRTFPVEFGGKENSDTTTLLLYSLTENEIRSGDFYNFTIPLLIIVLGSFLIIGIVIQKNSERQKQLVDQTIKLKKAEKQVKDKTDQLQEQKLKQIGILSSMLFHDIKNPLSIINNEITILNQLFKESIDESSKKSFKRMNSAVERIDNQINSVMNFVKEKHIEIQTHDISDIIDETCSSVSIPDKITLKKDVSHQKIECDKNMMINVFANLLRNAVEATKKGEISITTNDKDKFLEIQVKDSGSGILQDDLSEIFRFFSTTKKTGTGIGLAECKSTIEMHNGTISVLNNDDLGATFSVLLPKKQS